MRGKLKFCDLHYLLLRNIPAYAGKTDTPGLSGAQKGEHPRVCGENSINGGDPVPVNGTSPRMRGKPNFRSTSAFPFRNIPAYAGKTQSVSQLV